MADQLDPRSVHGRSLPVLSISGGPFGKLLPLAAQAAPSCVTALATTARLLPPKNPVSNPVLSPNMTL